MSIQADKKRFVTTLRCLPRAEALTYDTDENNVLICDWGCEMWRLLETYWLIHLGFLIFLALLGFSPFTAVLVDLLIWMTYRCIHYYTRMEKLLWLETFGAMYDEHGEVMYVRNI